jgi:peptidyl-prolyl cis-trans isomerase C
MTNALRQEAFDTFIAAREAATQVTRTDTTAMDPAVINQTNLLEN